MSHEAVYTRVLYPPERRTGPSRDHAALKAHQTQAASTWWGSAPTQFVGMVSIDDRPEEVDDRRVPGHWEGDLIIGAHGTSAAATLVERTTRFVTILALPLGKNSEGLCDVLIDHINTIPDVMRGSLTWDQGSEMARHAALTLATDMKVYFAHPRSPWERGTNENTNGLIREYLPKGTQITTHQPYLNAIAEELNERPRAALGWLTPREAYERLLVASTT